MEERTLAYQTLNLLQMLDVLRTSDTAVAAVCGGGPWASVMHVQLEVDGAQPVIHLSCGPEGRRIACLRTDPRMVLLYRRDTCTGTDTVIAEGVAEIIPAEGGVRLRLPVKQLSGRRYFAI